MLQYSNSMTLDYFNDFYYLEALKTDITTRMAQNKEVEFRHSAVRLLNDVNLLFGEVARNLAYRTFVYIWAACLGEARHAADTMAKDYFVEQLTQNHRGDVYSITRKFPPTPENVNSIIQVFSTEWRGSFGGKRWKHIAEALRFYEKDPITFIDHVIDLQHNTGTVFNKTESKDHLAFVCEYSGDLKIFLDYKFRCNILTEDYFEHNGYDRILLSREVYLLVKRHNMIFYGKDITRWVKPSFRTLPDYFVKWGKSQLKVGRKWRGWNEVRGGNLPSVHEAAELCTKEAENNIWKPVEEIHTLVTNVLCGYNFKKKTAVFRKINIAKMKFYNDQRLSMIPVKFQIFTYRNENNIKLASQWVSLSVKPAIPCKSTTNEWENGYLRVKQSVMYLVCEQGEIPLQTDKIPHFIRNTEV